MAKCIFESRFLPLNPERDLNSALPQQTKHHRRPPRATSSGRDLGIRDRFQDLAFGFHLIRLFSSNAHKTTALAKRPQCGTRPAGFPGQCESPRHEGRAPTVADSSEGSSGAGEEAGTTPGAGNPRRRRRREDGGERACGGFDPARQWRSSGITRGSIAPSRFGSSSSGPEEIGRAHV